MIGFEMRSLSVRSIASSMAQFAPFPSIVEMLSILAGVFDSCEGNVLENCISDKCHTACVPSFDALGDPDHMHICCIDQTLLCQSNESWIDIGD